MTSHSRRALYVSGQREKKKIENMHQHFPDGTFKLTSVANLALEHATENVIRIPHSKCHKLFHEFITLVSLKVPSGLYTYSRCRYVLAIAMQLG